MQPVSRSNVEYEITALLAVKADSMSARHSSQSSESCTSEKERPRFSYAVGWWWREAVNAMRCRQSQLRLTGKCRQQTRRRLICRNTSTRCLRRRWRVLRWRHIYVHSWKN